MPSPDAKIVAELREFADYIEAGDLTSDPHLRGYSIDMQRYVRYTPHADPELVDEYRLTLVLPADRKPFTPDNNRTNHGH
ncbi:hypothetical protein [Actinocrispum wychmicini]|uniref:Uncharacterized protein n=1 Tax=Actinocrispum wychmicini TaxID=1213861 RepID=A0A4R2JF28_9PSEU|nr:hypothetical protein [Actinocrispum wychmicini]TCO57167.1 hypothetical protein EV192_106644 [Actinocrispum wychmicini]